MARRKKRRWPKVIRIFITAVLLLTVLLAASYLVLKIVADKNGTFPGLLGVEFATEMTDRMEPKIEQGSLLLMKPTKNNEAGDVVVYMTAEDQKQYIVAEIIEKETIDGVNAYRMQYLNSSEKISGLVMQNQISSKVHYSISFLGYAVDFIDTVPGILTVVVLPCLIIIAIEIVRMVRIMRAKDTDGEGSGGSDFEQDEMFHVDNSYVSAPERKNTVYPGTFFRDLSVKEKDTEQQQDAVSHLAGINNQIIREESKKLVSTPMSEPSGEQAELFMPEQKEESVPSVQTVSDSGSEKMLTDVDRMIQEILGAERVPSDIIQQLKTIQSEESTPYHGLKPEIGNGYIRVDLEQSAPKSVSVMSEDGNRYLVVVTEEGESRIKIHF